MRGSRLRGTILPIGIILINLFLQNSCKEDKLDVYATGILDGTVMDFTSEELLSGAVLTTNPPTVSVASDSAGYFIFNNIDVGEYNLICRKKGYIAETVMIGVQQDKTSSVVLVMERSSEYNDPPYFSGNFSPAPGETLETIDVDLSWEASDPNLNDTLHYDVRVFEANDQVGEFYQGLEESSLSLQLLRFNTVYYWQVSAYDAYDTIQSDLLNFKTADTPDNYLLYTMMAQDGTYEIFSSDSLSSTVFQLTRNTRNDWQPRYNPQGNLIAYISYEGLEPHIFIMEPDGNNPHKITQSPITGYHNPGRGFTWSTDGNEIIYGHYDRMLYTNLALNIQGQYAATAPASRHFRDMDYSPRSRQVVVQTVGMVADSSEIYLYNLDGTDPMLLVPNLPGIIESPSYSVDGTKVIFTRDAAENVLPGSRQLDTRIFMINIATRQVTDLSHSKSLGTNDLNPRFSPNGAQIIFENSSNKEGSQSDLWIMDADGENRKLVIENASMPDWR